jgi:DNA-binding NtrC family response regulator
MAKRVFIVDDEHITNVINKRIIKTINPQVEVLDFTDPQEAFKQMRDKQPALVFLDLNMPELNGWEYLAKMEQEQLDIKVIIVTSSTSVVDRRRSTQFTNVIDYMEKPASLEALRFYLANDAAQQVA